MYKPVQELEQEAMTRIEKLYADAETFSLLRHYHALPRQRVAALLRQLADRLDLPSTTPARMVTEVNQ